MSDAPVTNCPECGGNVKRLISGGAGAITKGSAHSGAVERPACGFDGACCGPSGGCCGGMGCEE